MVINNLSSSSEPYYIVEESSGSTLQGRVDAKKFVQVTPPGRPPYSVTMYCNGITGITTTDVIISWYSDYDDGIVATYTGDGAEASE